MKVGQVRGDIVNMRNTTALLMVLSKSDAANVSNGNLRVNFAKIAVPEMG